MDADLIVRAARVRTLDPQQPTAEAVAIASGRVVAVGTFHDVLAWRGARTEVIERPEACLLPGFHDAHVHLAQHGMALAAVALHDVPDLPGALERVAARAASTPPGTWITGAGFALDRWGVRSLEATALDAIAPHHPVLLRSQDHHAGWANGAALAAAGIGAHTPDPAHGVIVRDAAGHPTGYLLEHAVDLVRAAVPPADRDTWLRAVRAAGSDLARRGITTVHHMAYEPPAAWRAIADVASGEDYPLRVWACVPQGDLEHAAAIGLAGGQGGARFVLGGAKFFADGALGSRTAWMLEPYLDTPGTGMTVDAPDTLRERFALAIAAGFAPVTHAIGDAAVRAVVDVLETSAPAWRAAGLRPRIEHVQHAHPDDVARLGRLGVTASMQPIHLTFDAPSIRAGLGDRVERAFPIRSLAAAGALLAFGSDTPVAVPDVFEGLRAAVRRVGVDGMPLGPDEAIDTETALRAFTRDAAEAIGRGHRSGRIRVGFDADLVLVDHDPFDDLDDLHVLATWSDGRRTHGAAT